MNDHTTPPPRSLRWRLPLIAALAAAVAVLALVPGLLPTLSAEGRQTLLGMAAGMGTALAVLLLVLLIPGARRTYFLLLEAREQGACADRRVRWFSGIALALYVLLVLLARWGVPQTASPLQVLVLGALPLLAMGLFVAATVLRLRQLDELMRKLEVESWALAALLVSQGYFAVWLLLRLGLVRIDAGNALLWVGVWLMVVQLVVYTWQLRKYL
ncbi:hypothetical protein EA658_19355 [Pseudoxanthomonas winnipegensis]|jgi:hypothetical protein|uniref:DUF4271 domain-containing protein n=1 Tax=Pseudoxanthomonas winnipegensis TaxID=2480810 RepID=A0ABY1W9G4_9GAMM|nr:hypothetical protein [Pseudoxanthomonas winnipegensis]TAA06910.1 hypothetical protein EA659_18750 [Pseudoxanthomonas winnipegensis]TAA16823.1 hypothetical protein EA658_19355 [Pseudoxanthomonas winnipegensis]TAH73550.1 hypothetical protein EA657_07735 [Pseudoxanthomonas winnipegensis]